MLEELHCLNCGKGFIPSCHITRQKFCSDKCRSRYHNAKRYFTDVPVNVCPECGEPIEQSEGAGRYRRFCGSRCRELYHYKKRLEKLQNRETPKQICPNCGVDFRPDWGLGKQRRFCGDACRIEWWRDYHKANPSLEIGPKWCEYCRKALNGNQKKYCSRDCYLKAMEETHSTEVCQWCGEEFSVYVGAERKYCSLNCARASSFAPKGAKKGKRRISAEDTETWRRKLTEAARSVPWSSDTKRVWLVCGATSAYTSLDGLASIIKYRLKRNPYDGSIYVFRDQSGRKLRYIEWDGQSFLQSKRNAQYGTYPWPGGGEGDVVEISEREFSYLLSDSIVPFKEKK